MAQLDTYLETIQPDLINVTRLFSIPDSLWKEPAFFHYVVSSNETDYICRFWTEKNSTERAAPIPVCSGDSRLDELHRRRTVRRLCRQTLYDLCKEMTGQHPPWGSLTGIRPTRLIYEALEHGSTMEQAVERLQSSFDVSLEKAALLREIVETQMALPHPADHWVDVYIGIPFCTTRCSYCSFSSGEIGDGHMVGPYLEALKREMKACASIPARTGRKLRALYIGGGTPTSLNEEQLAELLEWTKQCFPNCLEYTVEAGRPDTLTGGKLRIIQQAGTDRISINPQSMVDRTLRIIGRAHTAAQVEEAYEQARQAGISHINMDVIAGLPGEDLHDFEKTMEAAIRLHPESLTVHALAIKRSSRLHLESAPLPDPATASAMTRMGAETAHQMNMRAYYLYRQKNIAGNQENTGYALPGHACLYNVDIMEENTHILALGAGGISKRIYPEEGHIERSANVSNIEEYTRRVDEMIERKDELFGLSPSSPASD